MALLDICWQHLIRKKEEFENDGFKPNFDPSSYNIQPIQAKEAKNFILKYEWVGNMGTAKYNYGLFFDNLLASIVCYGPPVAPSKYKKLFGIENSHHILQLCRGATVYWAPVWAPSKLISQTLKMLYRDLGINIVVAYADPNAGEIGTIYQACNAVYAGMTDPGRGKKYIIDGHMYDPKKVVKKFGSRAHSKLLQIDPEYSTIPITPKHRYFFIIGTKAEKKNILEKLIDVCAPYPKR